MSRQVPPPLVPLSLITQAGDQWSLHWSPNCGCNQQEQGADPPGVYLYLPGRYSTCSFSTPILFLHPPYRSFFFFFFFFFFYYFSYMISPSHHEDTSLIPHPSVQSSLDQLMAALNQTQPHYIRCIKPNPSSTPRAPDPVYVHEQLAASGIVETVEVNRMGYPTR